jgi:hypothetical protein
MNKTTENHVAHGQVGDVGTGNSTPQFYYPRPDSVRGRILGAFLGGDRLTQKDSLRRFSDFRLAAHVESLRKRGWPIITESIEVVTGDAGRHAEVGRYSMPSYAVAEAGEVGQEFAEAARKAEIERRTA